jgi:hypothetical protein
MPMGDHEAVEGRTAVRPSGAGGVVRRSTENCMTLIRRRPYILWLLRRDIADRRAFMMAMTIG